MLAVDDLEQVGGWMPLVLEQALSRDFTYLALARRDSKKNH
jgi:hypothetical protein